jgi:hypothetical protein
MYYNKNNRGNIMEQLSEIWKIMDTNEYNIVWNKIYDDFCFKPNYKGDTFYFKMPFDTYDISETTLMQDDGKSNELMILTFIECMENDPFMYVLDWQHSCYYYNPRIKQNKENPTFIIDEKYQGGDYNAYFPEFYPNGDYYFFIAKDFRWGYFTHPWKMNVWVFGDKLMGKIKNNSNILNFKKI